jgi:hypothetical protein
MTTPHHSINVTSHVNYLLGFYSSIGMPVIVNATFLAKIIADGVYASDIRLMKVVVAP